SVVAARSPEAAALEDESVVAPDHGRRPIGAQRAKTFDAGAFERSFSLVRARPQRQLVANDLAVVAVDDRRPVRPSIVAAVDMRHFHRPALIAPGSSTDSALDARPWSRRPLIDEPAFDLQDAINGLAVDDQTVPEPQQRPQPSISKRRKIRNEAA